MDNNKNLFRIISASLLGLSVIVSVYFFLTDFENAESLATATGVFITLCYIFLGIAAVTAIVFPIITIAQNPKGAKNALIGVVAVAVVFAIGYAMSSGVETKNATGKLLATASEAKMSETGLIAFYIMAAGAIGSVIFAEVSKMFK